MSESTDRGPCSITACVIARDEAANLAELLPQLRWAEEVLVVVDDATTDGSEGVAALFADRVEVRSFRSFSAFRNQAMDLARGEWIFFVDADERVSAELAEEVRTVVTGERLIAHDLGEPVAPVACWVPRTNVMFGRPIRGGGWSPDHQLRLIRRGHGRYDEGRQVHEVIDLDGPAGYLHEPLLHVNYQSIGQFIEKQRRYTTMEADVLRSGSGRPRRRSLIGAPTRELIRRYVTLRGWADGPIGLFLALAMAYYAFQRVRLARATGSPPTEAPPGS